MQDPQPLSTHLLSDENDLASSTLAKRLGMQICQSSRELTISQFVFVHVASKTGCQCFVSLSIPNATIHAKIEDYLVKSIVENPRTFYF